MLQNPLDVSVALSEKVYQEIRKDVITLQLEPGSMVRESQLVDKYGVSKTPIREALNRLRQEKLITSVPYRGYIVAPIEAREVCDCFELREIVEPAAAGLAAERITPEHIADLERISNETPTAGTREEYMPYLENNRAFHVGVARATANREILSVVSNIFDRTYRLLYLGVRSGHLYLRMQYHYDLLDAFKKRDASGAQSIMREHIRHSMTNVMEIARDYPAAGGLK
ncbi:MAG: GntR family transcriptional regulator [Firmicutes bacterium]|nr:GntR family transcriptional regulator [Bacillota bacterium]